MIKFLFFLMTMVHVVSGEVITPIQTVKTTSPQKVELGKKLFFDPTFSKDEKVSCASCHSDFGSDSKSVSIGTDGKKGVIQSLSVFNAVNNYKLFWNGRAPNLYHQIDGSVHMAFEMGNSSKKVEEKLKASAFYQKEFIQAFGTPPTYQLFKEAIAEFEKTLVTPNSRFDRYLKGENTLSILEKNGFYMFKQHGCIACHNGVNIGGNSMQKMGNVIPYRYIKGQPDLYDLTKKEEDKNVFRVPSLRNVARTAPYFHDASAQTLAEAVQEMSEHNLGVMLNKDEVQAIVAFLKTLNGDIPMTWSSNAQ